MGDWLGEWDVLVEVRGEEVVLALGVVDMVCVALAQEEGVGALLGLALGLVAAVLLPVAVVVALELSVP